MQKCKVNIASPRQGKYRNKKCTINGITFHSLKEGKRYVALLALEKAGQIFKLQLQVPFKIVVNGKKVCTYRADFTYYDSAGKYIVEDTKGFQTPAYKLKKRLLFVTHNIEIVET